MDTRDRIEQIIKSEGLSQAAFAEATGINTSTLNHVLRGRNKPSSEVISKILRAYPKYESDWLLTGSGPALTADYREEQAKRSTVSLFPTPDDDHLPAASQQERCTTGASCSPTPSVSISAAPAPSPRRVRKVIIYYDDQTFETLYPAGSTDPTP